MGSRLFWKGIELRAARSGSLTRGSLDEEQQRIRQLKLKLFHEEAAPFGCLQFTEQRLASKEIARYACLSVNTDVVAVVNLLLRGWRLKPPSVIISVTGSAQGMSIEPRLENLFIEGLSSAAFCTNAWVITGGTNTGVMALAGKAMAARDGITGQSELTPVIGFCALGTIIGNESLTGAVGGSEHSGPLNYAPRSRTRHGSAALDENHTHFVLVDDGSAEYGAELALRADTEQLLRHELGVPGVQRETSGVPEPAPLNLRS